MGRAILADTIDSYLVGVPASARCSPPKGEAQELADTIDSYLVGVLALAGFADLRDHAVRLMKRRGRHGLCRRCNGEGKGDTDQQSDDCFLLYAARHPSRAWRIRMPSLTRGRAGGPTLWLATVILPRTIGAVVLVAKAAKPPSLGRGHGVDTTAGIRQGCCSSTQASCVTAARATWPLPTLQRRRQRRH